MYIITKSMIDRGDQLAQEDSRNHIGRLRHLLSCLRQLNGALIFEQRHFLQFCAIIIIIIVFITTKIFQIICSYTAWSARRGDEWWNKKGERGKTKLQSLPPLHTYTLASLSAMSPLRFLLKLVGLSSSITSNRINVGHMAGWVCDCTMQGGWTEDKPQALIWDLSK